MAITSLLPQMPTMKTVGTSTPSGPAPGVGPVPYGAGLPGAAPVSTGNVQNKLGYSGGGFWGGVPGAFSPPPSAPTTPSPNYGPLLGFTGLLGGSAANGQNAGLQAQINALGQQLLQPMGGGGGGGGNGASAAIANQIAGLQNQQHDLDINFLQGQLGQLPGINAQNLSDYHTALANITAQQNQAKNTTQQNQQQLTQDATARGAMTASGTAQSQNQLASGLINQLAQLHAQTSNAAGQYHTNQTNLAKNYGDIVTNIQKLQIQKQIEAAQARAAGLGGGGGNPFAGLTSFLSRMSASQQLAQLQGQMVNPLTAQQGFLNQYTQLQQLGGNALAQQWLMRMLQAYGIQIPNFAQGNLTGGLQVQPGQRFA